MPEPLLPKDIDGKYVKKIFMQDYTKKPLIEGVKIIEVRNMIGEDGDFSELMRLNENGESIDFPGFFLKQVNRSKMLPGSIKAWHVHYNQEDIWSIRPEDKLTVGLWDLRKDSPTKGMTMKLPLGGGKAHLVYIPRGVAHGAANISLETSTMIYFVNQHFNIDNPDEQRLPWDSVDEFFWEAPRE
jgi:dTDP-4-dehydrorhamnose 3,5-epimerase